MSKKRNKIIKDQKYKKNARTSGAYDEIWQNTGKCVFCDLKNKYILYQENGVALTINVYPYIDGQLMAIPLNHISSPKELSQTQWETIRKYAYIAKKIIRKVHKHKGMWTLIREGGINAQMSVTDHLHVQFIPFDKPDLCAWNYRELKHTPLQNTKLYHQQNKNIIKKIIKFNKKYQNQTKLPVICDCIIINNKQEILFQKRKANLKINDDFLSLPGGHINPQAKSLTKELKREVFEETNYNLAKTKLILLDSRIDTINYQRQSKYLKIKYLEPYKIIWNTYLATSFNLEQILKAKDDCQALVWIPYKKAIKHNKLSSKLKKTLKKQQKLICQKK